MRRRASARVSVADWMANPVNRQQERVDAIVSAVKAGVDSIEHGSFLTDETMQLMKAKGTYLVPTLLAGQTVVGKVDKLPPEIAVKARAAGAALAAGADLVNDVSALRYDPEMLRTVVEEGAGVVLMHMRGHDPRTMQVDTAYEHPVADVASDLAAAASSAVEAGVAADGIAVDPGLGFGKSPDGNLQLLRHLAAFRSLGFAVAVGASRKAFVRRFSGVADDASSANVVQTCTCLRRSSRPRSRPRESPSRC